MTDFFVIHFYFYLSLQKITDMDDEKKTLNSKYKFEYDDVRGLLHVTNNETGEDYYLLKEDAGWCDGEYKFDV